MRRDLGRPVAAHSGEVALAPLVVGGGEDLAFSAEPFHAARAVQRSPVLVPPRRIGAAEAEHNVLRDGERQLTRRDLDGEQNDVHVMEEVEVHVRHIEVDRRSLVAERHPGALHVAAANHVDR